MLEEDTVKTETVDVPTLRKLYAPESQEAKDNLQETLDIWKKVAGPTSADMVDMFIREEKPAYPEYNQEEVDGSLMAHSNTWRERAQTSPSELLNFLKIHDLGLTKQIENEKLSGAARGESEPNNRALKQLGEKKVLLARKMVQVRSELAEKGIKISQNNSGAKAD